MKVLTLTLSRTRFNPKTAAEDADVAPLKERKYLGQQIEAWVRCVLRGSVRREANVYKIWGVRVMSTLSTLWLQGNWEART